MLRDTLRRENRPRSVLHSTESLTGYVQGWSCILWLTMHFTSLPLSAGLGTSRYSLRTVTVPSGPFAMLVEWLPLSNGSHVMVAAGLPSAALHWATTTDLEPARTVTTLAEFFGLAVRAEVETRRIRKKERELEDFTNRQKKLS